MAIRLLTLLLLPGNETIAVFIARVFLGLLFFFQGVDAVFRIKPKYVFSAINDPLRERGVPRLLIVLGAYFTSYVELIAGFCLVPGFAKPAALGLLGIDLLVASVAFGLIKPMWDMQHVFPRLALLLFLLLVPAQWDVWSIDHAWSVTAYVQSLFN